MGEIKFQAHIMEKLDELFPGCIIIRNDPTWHQGWPDLLILFEDKWAMLEVKADEYSPVQPNQPYWVAEFDKLSFATFIYPQNEEEVLDALQQTFGSHRSRVS